jgi:DNA-binding transcriptional ArsR family regulator
LESETWSYISALNNNYIKGKENDIDQLTKFLKDPIVLRIVRILDITSLSILELLEYDLTRRDINHAFSNSVIKIDKSASSSAASAYEEMLLLAETIIFLNNKVKLTDVGLQILESIKGE